MTSEHFLDTNAMTDSVDEHHGKTILLSASLPAVIQGGSPGSGEPDSTWSLDQLAAYAHGKLDQFFGLAKKSTVEVFRAGQALVLARNQIAKDRAWGKWLKEKGIPRTTAWEAIQLVEKAEKEEAVADLTPPEAFKRFGVRKTRTKAVKTADSTEDNDIVDEAHTLASQQLPPTAPKDLLSFFTLIEKLLERAFQDRDKLDWEQQRIAETGKKIEDIVTVLDRWLAELDEKASATLAA